MILLDDATPKLDEIFGKDNLIAILDAGKRNIGGRELPAPATHEALVTAYGQKIETGEDVGQGAAMDFWATS